MAKKKINIKDRVNADGEIDLSMSDLQDVPVKEISIYKKAISLDLSNNHLKTLPNNFCILTHIIKLDLSKNELSELPQNFGDLINLKHLDLYQNKLQYLPLSFSKLQSLKWLDLKDNSLVPAVAKVAGPCLNSKQCQTCAKDVINFFKQVQDKVEEERNVRQKQREKQLVNNQVKEKKKKEKHKNKKDSNGVSKEVELKVSSSIQKNKKKSVGGQNIKKNNSLKKFYILLFVIFALILFVGSLIFFDNLYVESFYFNALNILPRGLQNFFITLGFFIKEIYDKVVNYVTSSNLYQTIMEKFYGFVKI